MSDDLGRIPVLTRPDERGSWDERAVHETANARSSTSLLERYLLIAIIIFIPVQDLLPTLGQFSVSYVLFALTLIHVVINRPQVLKRTWTAPPFLPLYALIVFGIVMEMWHPRTDYTVAVQIAEMTGGAILIASLCRDRAALRVATVGFLLVGFILAVILYPTCYGVLAGSNATDFVEATNLREQALQGSVLQINANRMAFFAAQASAIALALSLYARSTRQRLFLLSLCIFCLVATFLPVSRSGVLCVLCSCAAVLLTCQGRGKLVKSLVMGVALGGAILYLVPSSVFSRMSYSTAEVNGKQEARARVYTASIINLPTYIATGVGAGNYWDSWGIDHGFYHSQGTPDGKTIYTVLGAHNVFFQVTIYWGIGGLLLVLLTVGLTYFSLPRKHKDDVLAVCIYGIATSILVLMFAIHALYAKEFSLGLGVIVGARRWLWRGRTEGGISEEVSL